MLTHRSEVVLSLALLAVLVVLLLPLPAFLLDMLLAANIGASVLLLLIAIGAKQPLELAVFPSLLLLMTLCRLSLNVATTRLILLHGDAGKIVATFGDFVVGGDLIVGVVVFIILVVIQFIVITRGSGRISEVAARFTLDAMPGKQMAIDAELGAGAIDEIEARRRRDEITREAEFYGAMDGAGKFVRGDAIAGLLVTSVNLVGGVILGVTHGMSILDAVKRYSILTIGDGLVSQIPAVIIATTAGILVTKAASKMTLAEEIGVQMFRNKQPLWIGTFILALLAFVPGLPSIPFLAFAGGLALFLRNYTPPEQPTPEAEEQPPTEEPADREARQLNEFLLQDRLGVEIGVRLTPLVESTTSKGLAERVASLRRETTRKHGVWVPTIRLRDNMQLDPNSYRILIGGREVAAGSLRTDRLLAIAPGETKLELDGEPTQEPAFGLPALWIAPAARQRAEIGGYAVVDPATVLITHLGEVLKNYAHELLSREDLQKMLDRVKESSPSLLEDLRPDVMRVGTLHQVLIGLLRERVSIRDLTRILECLVHHAHKSSDPEDLVERVREALGRTVCERFRDEQGRIRVVIVDPRLEHALRGKVHEKSLTLDPAELERFVTALSEHWRKANTAGHEVALLCDAPLRRPIRRAVERALNELSVIAYNEVPTDTQIHAVGMIRHEDVLRPAPAAPSTAPAGHPPNANRPAA